MRRFWSTRSDLVIARARVSSSAFPYAAQAPGFRPAHSLHTGGKTQSRQRLFGGPCRLVNSSPWIALADWPGRRTVRNLCCQSPGSVTRVRQESSHRAVNLAAAAPHPPRWHALHPRSLLPRPGIELAHAGLRRVRQWHRTAEGARLDLMTHGAAWRTKGDGHAARTRDALPLGARHRFRGWSHPTGRAGDARLSGARTSAASSSPSASTAVRRSSSPRTRSKSCVRPTRDPTSAQEDRK